MKELVNLHYPIIMEKLKIAQAATEDLIAHQNAFQAALSVKLSIDEKDKNIQVIELLKRAFEKL